MRPRRLYYQDEVKACNTMGFAPDCYTEKCVISSSSSFYPYLLRVGVSEPHGEDAERGERHTRFSTEVCCKPPLSIRVSLSRVTAHKSPSMEVLKIRFVLGDPGIYCFNIDILFIPTQNLDLYHP